MKRANPVWSSAASQDATEKLNLFNSFTKQKVTTFLIIQNLTKKRKKEAEIIF